MITLETQVPITTVRIDQITIQLNRDGGEATATVSILDANGNVIRREITQHPNPNAFIKQIIANPKAAFDFIDGLLLAKYPGAAVTNSDINW
jgi:hypothetical protein